MGIHSRNLHIPHQNLSRESSGGLVLPIHLHLGASPLSPLLLLHGWRFEVHRVLAHVALRSSREKDLNCHAILESAQTPGFRSVSRLSRQIDHSREWRYGSDRTRSLGPPLRLCFPPLCNCVVRSTFQDGKQRSSLRSEPPPITAWPFSSFFLLSSFQ